MGGDITMQSTFGEGSKFAIRLPFSTTVYREQPAPLEGLSLTAMIFASQANCLQEIQSLFNRAGVETESELIEGQDSIDPIIDNIQNNLKFIDMIVFDLRHLTLNMNEILAQLLTYKIKVILIHYDQSMVAEYDYQNYQFISNIITSSYLRSLLHTAPAGQKTVRKMKSPTESPDAARCRITV